MRVSVLIGLTAALVWQSAPPRRNVAAITTPSKSPMARVTGIERAPITLPGITVKDYDACMKSAEEVPDFEGKKGVVEELKKNCKRLDEIHKTTGVLPGYYPPTKELGYMVAFETVTARYVVSTLGSCKEILENGQCGGEWVPNVVVGKSYIFADSCTGEAYVCLSRPPPRRAPSQRLD